MNFKTINKNYLGIKDGKLLETLLKTRGVEDIEGFLNVNENDVLDGMGLLNMDRGLSMFNWHIKNNSKIHIVAD